ncbi:SDR family NAD(P)-dependent oxidoreductase [Streptomyces sp. ADMS]|uniref:SDR family NAD(P)-dependent oxidoreductase n=1 Tax=Streptomyces sp. ADMS TaxID=3071415 RepID=UPI00296E6EF3|nr:SDR family NAD(P)-dependent oxidoreductase [Streptomyces sp. ADMS]MDW4907702.1 SDR family NAD(P)-dependent oxidoreductase [Streptomyces sp. ADMS]
MSKIWFITGSSRGLGHRIAQAALRRGDRVAATARDTRALADLVADHGDAVLPLPLDVTDRAAAFNAVQRAHDHFGRLDVVVNNADYALGGAVEELGEQQLRDQLETAFFGAVWVTQAALPLLRAQGSGHIVQISSLSGVVAHPIMGGYAAAKWALEGLTESLAQEVAPFGVKATLVEPGAFATDVTSSAVLATPIDVYGPTRQDVLAQLTNSKAGDPAAAARALLRIVDAEKPPLRVLFGAHAYEFTQHVYAERLKSWSEWAYLSTEADGA